VATGSEEKEARQIGARIAARMSEIGVDRAQLANSLNLSEDSIYKLVRGDTVSRWVHLIMLARALRTSPNEILGFDGPDARPRLQALLEAAFQGLAIPEELAKSSTRIYFEALDKPSNPQSSVSEVDELRIEVAYSKRRFECP
jgi:hypothetical protein